MRKITGTLQGKLSSFLHLSRAPTPSLIDIDSSSDNDITMTSARTRRVTESFCSNCYLTSPYFTVICHSIWSLPLATSTHLPQRLLLIQNSNHTQYLPQIRYPFQRWYPPCPGNLILLVSQDQTLFSRSVAMFALMTVIVVNYYLFSARLRIPIIQ